MSLMRLTHRASFASLSLLLLSGACVAKEPDSLGDLESSGDDGATSDPTAGTGGSESGSSESGSGGPTDPCVDPSLDHYEPSGCPGDAAPILPAAGCYEPCDGPGDACAVGACVQVEINPCVCPEGEDCCAACGSIEWLCVEGLPDACDAIVGTTFSSIEELECGLGPEGPIPCHWTVAFEEDGDYLWQYSDLGEGGSYACEAGVITVLNNPGLDVSYDPASGILTWDGVEYVADPA